MREGHGVHVQRVKFDSSGEVLVGHMYMPGPMDGARRPAVVVAGAWAAHASELSQPLLVVHSDDAVNPDSVRQFVTAVPSPVEQVWLDAVTQFDFYDQTGPMTAASDAAADHFEHSLSLR